MTYDRDHIAVAIPTMDNQVAATMLCFVEAIDRLSANTECPWKFTLLTCNGVTPVEYARNMLVRDFLATSAGRLWFIDADMIPDHTAFQLLYVESDIAAGRMYKFSHGNPQTGHPGGVSLCAFRATKTPWVFKPVIPQNGDQCIQEVDGVGTASMLIRREVLEDERILLSPQYRLPDNTIASLDLEKDDPRWAPPIFRTIRAPNGRPLIGEDLDFCARAKELGYTIKVHLGAKVGHFKAIEIDQMVEHTYKALARATGHDCSGDTILRAAG